MALSEGYIADIAQRGEQYDYLNDVKEGSYLDAKDTVSNWWVARIKEVNDKNEEFSLHFDGWSSKYDEDIPFNSTRIDPFRMITVGYTGMKNSSKREEWKYHFGDLETIK